MTLTNSGTRPIQKQILNINELPTMSILWHLVYRHRVVLLITSNLVTLTIWIVQQGPVAVHNFMR